MAGPNVAGMAAAARTTIVQVDDFAELTALLGIPLADGTARATS
jgi:hypothetical protein